MRTVRRSRRLSANILPDSLEQCVPGGFDYLHVGHREPPPVEYPVATTKISYDQPLSPQAIESLSAFADQRELTPPDLHSQQCRGRRKGKNGNAPRPPNAFMLFRSDFWKFNKATIPERDHRQISRIAAHCWNALSEPRRVPYQDQARRLKEEHALLYPQHKYNSSAKDRARKKVKKEVDEEELYDFLAARSVGRASESPMTSSGSSLLDQVMNSRKAGPKRSRSASVAFCEQSSAHRPVKKTKRALHIPSADAVQSHTGLSHSSLSPFVPTHEIPFFTLPPSCNSPAIKGEPIQDSIPGMAMHTVALKNEPWSSPPGMAEPPKMETSSEIEVPEVSPLFSPQFPPIKFEPPVEYLERSMDTVVDKGLQIFEHYGMVGFFDGLDFSYFDHLGDAPASMGTPEENDEFARWCLNPAAC